MSKTAQKRLISNSRPTSSTSTCFDHLYWTKQDLEVILHTNCAPSLALKKTNCTVFMNPFAACAPSRSVSWVLFQERSPGAQEVIQVFWQQQHCFIAWSTTATAARQARKTEPLQEYEDTLWRLVGSHRTTYLEINIRTCAFTWHTKKH